MFNRVWIAVMAVLAPAFAHSTVMVVDGGNTRGGGLVKPIIRPLGHMSGKADAAATEDAMDSLAAPAGQKVWIIDPKRDKSYREVFQKWADESDWTLLWQLPQGYAPRNKSSLTGEFSSVFSKAIKGLGSTIGALDVKFYTGNRVVTVGFLPVKRSETTYMKLGKKTVPVTTESPASDTAITFLEDAYIGVASDPATTSKASVSLASSLGAGETVITAPSGKAVVSTMEPVAQPVEPPPTQEWKVTSADKDVRSLLDRWSKEAKEARYQILWEVPRDLELGAIATVSGTFEDALDSVLLSLVDAEYPIEAVMYDGNNVVRIVKHIPGNK